MVAMSPFFTASWADFDGLPSSAEWRAFFWQN